MHETLQTFLEHATRLWRRRWLALAVTACLSVCGWSLVLLLPDRYVSHAKLYVDTTNVLRPLLSGLAVDTDLADQVDMMRRTLLARPNLEKVARLADLDLAIRSPEEHERLIRRLAESVEVTSDRADLFTISYGSTDPVKAREVVDALMRVFVENNLGAKRNDYESAQDFINTQVSDYARQLAEAERKLAEFRQRHIMLLGGDGVDFQKRLEAATEHVRGLESELKDTEAQQEAMRAAMRGLPQFYSAGGGMGPPTGMDLEVMELQARIQDLKSRYTDQHPDVVAARRKLEALLAEASQVPTVEPGADGEGGTGAAIGLPNPTYSQVQLEVIRLGSLAEVIRAKLDRARAGLETLEAARQQMPAIEAERMQLNRDYGVIRDKYEALLSRREQARLSESRESSGGKVSFRTIEPPIVPIMPAGPNRPLLYAGVFVLAIGAGLAAGFVQGMLREDFLTLRELRGASALPVLGAISMTIPAGGGGGRLAGLGFTTGCVALVGTLVALILVDLRLGSDERARAIAARAGQQALLTPIHDSPTREGR